MLKPILFLPTLAFILLSTACGSVRNHVVVAPDNIAELKQLTVALAEVQSKEQNSDVDALNEQLKAMATEEMQSMVAGKGKSSSGASQGIVSCRIEVVYGSRMLRYMVGFTGAGSGHITVNIELKDNSGKVRYATKSESDLSMGAFGGNMVTVTRKTIKKAAADFAEQL